MSDTGNAFCLAVREHSNVAVRQNKSEAGMDEVPEADCRKSAERLNREIPGRRLTAVAFDNLIWPTFDTFIWPTPRP